MKNLIDNIVNHSLNTEFHGATEIAVSKNSDLGKLIKNENLEELNKELLVHNLKLIDLDNTVEYKVNSLMKNHYFIKLNI